MVAAADAHAAAPPYDEWRVLPVATLTSIATVIGSGILALPVTLYATQLPVFLFLFTLSMVAQIGVVHAIVELMQRARSAVRARGAAAPTATYHATPPAPAPPHPPDVSLFTIANLYLPNPALRYAYFVTTFLCFVTIIVSYGLAGPQAVWQLLSSAAQSPAPPRALFVAYWVLGTVAVLFFMRQLLPVFGSFTVLKGALFVGVVAIVALLPDEAHVETVESLFTDFSGWRAAAAPFLMSCVALGGLANTVPVTFNLLPGNASPSQVSRYRASIVLAVVLCYLLNVGWVLAVLQVVPRTAPDGLSSLTVAYEQGQISTVPLIATLHHGHAVQGVVLQAIETIVEMFIFVSTGVSFFVCSAGMKSFVDGGADSLYENFPVLARSEFSWIPKVFAYTISFGSVLYIIVANPNGFIEVLTRFTSFTVNLQAGALLFIMLYYSRGKLSLGPFLLQRGGDEAAQIDAELGQGPGKQTEKTVASMDFWEYSQEKDAPHEAPPTVDDIPLSMSDTVASMWMAYGTFFFATACALAALGPMLGVKLGGRE